MSGPLFERDPEAWNAYLAEGNAKQARKRVAVDALLRDDDGRILVVKPDYKPGWDLPGRMVEANEPPLDALRRELTEELDLDVADFRLLCIDWVPPHGPWDDQLALIFEGGVVAANAAHPHHPGLCRGQGRSGAAVAARQRVDRVPVRACRGARFTASAATMAKGSRRARSATAQGRAAVPPRRFSNTW